MSDATHAALREHYATVSKSSLTDLFAADARRFERFSTEFEGLFLDYSRNLVTDETLNLLFERLQATAFDGAREQLLVGQLRYADLPDAVAHTLLRDASAAPSDLRAAVEEAQRRFLDFAESVRAGDYAGASGAPISDVVNLGIGGGHLGAALACIALRQNDARLRAHCVSSSESRRLRQLLVELNPETTLFVVSSRSFQTSETLSASQTARAWIRASKPLSKAWARHFVAATGNIDAAVAFGLPAKQCYFIPAGVNGRMSLWSAAGLAPAMLIGRERFTAMLDGAAAMDAHFKTAPWRDNMPVLLALLNAWHADLCGYASQAVLVYEERLAELPAYLQQLHMECNGKSVTRDGAPLTHSAPVVWGGMGLDGQHAYYQMLHQGTRPVACDFILTAEPDNEFAHANCLAQTRALMEGSDHDDPQKRIPGNRSSTTLLMRRLSPRYFGMLVALYEHKIFTQSMLWGMNPFSQWGVELGKRMASELLPLVRGEAVGETFDQATQGLSRQYRAWRDD